MKAVALVLSALVWAAPAFAQSVHDHNAQFRAHDLDVEAWVKRLENPERDVIAHLDGVVTALHLAPGMAVADIGAGTGPYMEPVARAVGPQGRYFGVDIAPGFLAHMRARAASAGLDNVTLVLSRPDSATLPDATFDLIFTVNTYHHFDPVAPMLASIRAALKPGGSFVVVDFDRVEGKSRQWILERVRADKDTFRAEIEAAGFRFVEDVSDTGLAENFFLRFQKPE